MKTQTLAVGLLKLGGATVLAAPVGVLLGTSALVPLVPVGAVLFALGVLVLLTARD